MKEVTRLISVKQLFSSPCHPMANGLCEKCNGTLKKMLIRMSNEQPKEWDRFIEPTRRIKIGEQHRLFHINMLRKYIDREPVLCAVAAGKCPKKVPDSHPSSCFTDEP